MSRALAKQPVGGVRWDKVGRLAMLTVVIALLGLYIRSGLSLWSAWQASRVDSAKVFSLKAQNARLRAQHSQLREPWVMEAAARRLGMAHEGEKAYVIRGLPPN